MARRSRFTIALLAVGALLGALREFLFLNLNYQLDHVRRHTPFSFAHSLFQGWTAGMDLAALTRLKWLLALAFIAMMWLLCLVLVNALGEARRTRLVSFTFLSVAALALLLHSVARWCVGLEAVSVKLLHLLQYPVILFFIWAASMLDRRTRPS